MLFINEDLLKSRRYVIVQLPNNQLQTETTLKGLFLTKEQAELSLKAKRYIFYPLVHYLLEDGSFPYIHESK